VSGDAREILEELLAARTDRSAERAAELLHADVEYWDPEHDRVSGRDAVAALLTSRAGQLELETLAAQDGDAVAEVQVDEGAGPFRSTEVYRLEDGVVAALRVYFDPAVRS
jgi:limonene-1,2-epoxide hydrolase